MDQVLLVRLGREELAEQKEQGGQQKNQEGVVGDEPFMRIKTN